MFYSGKFVYCVTIRLALKNNGILEPEFRLWVFSYDIKCSWSCVWLNIILYAHWTISVILGQGFLRWSHQEPFASHIDSYHKLASESLVLMLFIINCIGCGFAFAIQPWLDRCGLSLTTWLASTWTTSCLTGLFHGYSVTRSYGVLYSLMTKLSSSIFLYSLLNNVWLHIAPTIDIPTAAPTL